MTRLRRPKSIIGRSPWALRLPFVGPQTLDTATSNFREIARWAAELPAPDDGKFVPYYVEYQSETAEEEFDINLFELLHADYGMDLVPTGLWIVGASATSDNIVADAVGATVSIGIFGDASFTRVKNERGYNNFDAPFELITDIDFTAETFTKGWFLPPLTGDFDNFMSETTRLVRIEQAEDEIRVEAFGLATVFDDPTTSSMLLQVPMPVLLKVWAYRLTDYFTLADNIAQIDA